MVLIDPFLSKLIFGSAIAYTLVTTLGYLLNRTEQQRLIGISCGAVLSITVFLVFRPFSGLQSFGPSPVLLVAMILVAIILGTCAEYLFSLGRKKFSWYKMIRPTLISPILLLPLVGLLQKSNELDALATISLLLVAFQNGFFWREMIEKLRGAL